MIDDGTCNWALVVFLKGAAFFASINYDSNSKETKII